MLVATGADWRRDGVGRWHTHGLPIAEGAQVLSPTDLFAGRMPEGKRVVVYDDDHYYMGGAVAEHLKAQGYDVSIVTPSAQVSQWTVNTFEVIQILKKINDLGTTVLLTTHNKGVIDSLRKRVITMDRGKIVRDDKEGKYIL